MRNRFHWVIDTPPANLEKAVIAMRLRQETTRTIKPIASRPGLRHPKSASPRPREWHIDHPSTKHPVHLPAELIGRYFVMGRSDDPFRRFENSGVLLRVWEKSSRQAPMIAACSQTPFALYIDQYEAGSEPDVTRGEADDDA